MRNRTANRNGSICLKRATAIGCYQLQKRKMSFKDKHALETLPNEIEKLGDNIAALQEAMAVPDFHSTNPAGFEKAAADLKAEQTRLSQAEERWLELEMLREEFDR